MRLSLPSLLFFGGILFLFLSNSSGVPQAVTKAPGESGQNCGACHSGGNFNSAITLTVKDTDGNVVNSYKPGQNYQLEVKVTGQNNPRSFGFQMVSLSDSGNKDMGNWSDLGQRVKSITLLQRKYLVQSSAKMDGIFTATWKAPSADTSNISFYYSGLAINLNGNTNGDSPVSGKLTLTPGSTSTQSDDNLLSIVLYPNPVQDILYLSCPYELNEVKVYNLKGQKVLQQQSNLQEGITVQHLLPGPYLIEVAGKGAKKPKMFSFVKF